MKARIVRIGNSRGVRIPKPLLEQSGIGDEVEMEVEGHQIVLRPVVPVVHPREGWASAFKEMAERGDDAVLDPDVAGSPEWDDEEWEW